MARSRAADDGNARGRRLDGRRLITLRTGRGCQIACYHWLDWLGAWEGPAEIAPPPATPPAEGKGAVEEPAVETIIESTVTDAVEEPTVKAFMESTVTDEPEFIKSGEAPVPEEVPAREETARAGAQKKVRPRMKSPEGRRSA